MQLQQLHHEIATVGDSKICTGAQPGGLETASRGYKRLNETSHLGHFFINFEVHTRVFHITWGGGG